jgi:hypothetical protein
MKLIKLVFLVGLLLVLALLYSCDVYYSTPQPSWIKNEKVVPEKLRGNYLSYKGFNGSGHSKDKAGPQDTARISEKRIFIDNDWDFTLSDSVLLRTYQHKYFLNLFDVERKSWVVIMGKIENDKIIYYTITSDDKEMIGRLKGITQVKNSEPNLSDYYINPSRKEFRKMLKSDLFAPVDTLFRLNKTR